MKLLPSFKSAKALALTAVTIATAIAGNITPSQASQPTNILYTPGQPQLAVFGSELKAFKIGCQELRDVWSGLQTMEVRLPIYQKVISNFGGVAGELFCNSPSRVKGYISPAFGGNTGVLVTDGKPFFVKSGEFYKAMGVIPTQLNKEQGNLFIQQHPQIKSNPILEPKTASGNAIQIPTEVAKPPSGGGLLSFYNRGGYVARYTLKFNINGTVLEFKKDNVAINGRESLSVPDGARRITVKGEAYTGIFNQTKLIFERSYPAGLPSSNNICFKTFGTTVNPGVNDNPGFVDTCIP